jgi:phosphate butyryltransferase
MIRTLDQLEENVLKSGKSYRLAVAWAQDVNTIQAVARAVEKGFVEAILVGNPSEIIKTCNKVNINYKPFSILEAANESEAARLSVKMVKEGEADIVMKGLVGTDKFLREVMDKEKGLMLPNAVLSYVMALEIPAYHKLLFITDPAVIPFPDLDQKIAMAQHAIGMARRFGVEKPKVALIGASEKMSGKFANAVDYAIMCKMADRGQIKDCIMDGPLDLFLACDRKVLK